MNVPYWAVPTAFGWLLSCSVELLYTPDIQSPGKTPIYVIALGCDYFWYAIAWGRFEICTGTIDFANKSHCLCLISSSSLRSLDIILPKCVIVSFQCRSVLSVTLQEDFGNHACQQVGSTHSHHIQPKIGSNFFSLTPLTEQCWC